jgi:hypothetical protein
MTATTVSVAVVRGRETLMIRLWTVLSFAVVLMALEAALSATLR